MIVSRGFLPWLSIFMMPFTFKWKSHCAITTFWKEFFPHGTKTSAWSISKYKALREKQRWKNKRGQLPQFLGPRTFLSNLATSVPRGDITMHFSCPSHLEVFKNEFSTFLSHKGWEFFPLHSIKCLFEDEATSWRRDAAGGSKSRAARNHGRLFGNFPNSSRIKEWSSAMAGSCCQKLV